MSDDLDPSVRSAIMQRRSAMQIMLDHRERGVDKTVADLFAYSKTTLVSPCAPVVTVGSRLEPNNDGTRSACLVFSCFGARLIVHPEDGITLEDSVV